MVIICNYHFLFVYLSNKENDMANDVINIVTILGDSSIVQEVMRVLVDKNKQVSFNNFVPMPDEIRTTSSPSRIVEKHVFDNYILSVFSGTVSPIDLRNPPITDDMAFALLNKYGVDNWRDWSKLNWGTPQNALETTIISHNKVKFFTDDNCPYEALNSLSKLFPTIKIKLQWADEDLGYNVGEMFIKDGVVIESTAPKNGSFEAFEMAISITDDRFYITDFLYAVEEWELDNEFITMCIKLAFRFRVADEMFPSFILSKFEEWAVREEDYEFASEVVKLIK